MREYLRKGNDVFEIVDTVPLGYSIWNIGHNMPDGYLPFWMPLDAAPVMT